MHNLNLSIANYEYAQFAGVLNKITKTFQVKDLLISLLSNEKAKIELVDKICKAENVLFLKNTFLSMSNKELRTSLIEGLILKRDNLTKFLSKDRFILKPLHNFFFTRDASVTINEQVLISKMASDVRARETIIMDYIFNYYDGFNTETINLNSSKLEMPDFSIEGGDVLIAREDVLIIGLGARSTSHGIDLLIEKFKKEKLKKHIIIQELPTTPESFIHLDMVFTFLDNDKCMVYSRR